MRGEIVRKLSGNYTCKLRKFSFISRFLQNPVTKKIAFILIRTLPGVALLYYLVWSDMLDLRWVWSKRSDRILYFCGSIFFYFMCIAVLSLRWYLLLRALGMIHRFRLIFQLCMVGQFFTVFLPGGTSGDLARGYYLYRKGYRAAQVLASIVMDRIMGAFGMVLFGLIIFATAFENLHQSTALRIMAISYVLALTTGVCMIWIVRRSFLSHIRGGKWTGPALTALRSIPGRHPAVALGILITLASYAFLAAAMWMSSLYLDIKIPFLQHGFAMPAITALNSLPVAPAGLGVGEAAAEFMYRFFDTNRGSAIMLVLHAAIAINSALAFPFYAMLPPKKLAQSAQEA